MSAYPFGGEGLASSTEFSRVSQFSLAEAAVVGSTMATEFPSVEFRYTEYNPDRGVAAYELEGCGLDVQFVDPSDETTMALFANSLKRRPYAGLFPREVAEVAIDQIRRAAARSTEGIDINA